MMVQLASSALLLPHSRENGRCRRRGSRRKVDPPRAELSQRSPPGASSSSARALSASGTAEAQTQQATASGCPYTAAKSAAKSAFAAVSGAVHQLGGGAERPGAGAEYTGPSNPLEHARTLFTIATLGMERATLAFLQVRVVVVVSPWSDRWPPSRTPHSPSSIISYIHRLILHPVGVNSPAFRCSLLNQQLERFLLFVQDA